MWCHPQEPHSEAIISQFQLSPTLLPPSAPTACSDFNDFQDHFTPINHDPFLPEMYPQPSPSHQHMCSGSSSPLQSHLPTTVEPIKSTTTSANSCAYLFQPQMSTAVSTCAELNNPFLRNVSTTDYQFHSNTTVVSTPVAPTTNLRPVQTIISPYASNFTNVSPIIHPIYPNFEQDFVDFDHNFTALPSSLHHHLHSIILSHPALSWVQ